MRRAIPYNPVWPFMTVWILVTGLALWWGAWWTYENHLFADHARHIQGTVLRKFVVESHGKNGTTYTYHMVYAYQAGDLLANCETVVHGGTWSAFSEGSSVPVKYLPEQPQNSRIDDAPEDYMALTKARIGTVVGLASLLAGGACLAYAIKRNKQQKRLIARGVSCLGRVTSMETENPTRKQVRIYLKFEFTDNQGRVVEGRTWDLNSKQESAWGEGRLLKVFYDPANSSIFTVDLGQSFQPT